MILFLNRNAAPLRRLACCVCAILMGLPAIRAQALPMRTLASVPGTVVETSGLICTGPNSLWTHNDSGGDPKLVQIDTNGVQLRAVVVRATPNIDWEELTQDSVGHVYVGDFGNNNNDRTGLVILKLPKLDTVIGDTVTPERIDFSYEDQFAFPPVASLQNFDMEAMVAYGDSLYLFSKNRTVPFDGYTKMYRLPQAPGTYVAELIDSFYTGPGPTLNYWISGAALSPAGDRLLLMSYARCFIFSCFEGADFFGGAVVQRTWTFTQKEAAAWLDSTHLYLTDELLTNTGGKLYLADMSAFESAPLADLGSDTTFVGDTLWLSAPSNPGGQFLWSTGETSAMIPITQSGTYWLQVTAANGCIARDTIQVNVIVQVMGPSNGWTMQVLPNPSHGKPLFEIKGFAGERVQWQLINPLGHITASGSLEANGSGQVSWGLDQPIAPGVYWMQAAGSGERLVCKVLVR